MLVKKYAEDRSACLVTFILPAALIAETAYLVGEFNGWDPEALPMALQDDGQFVATIELAAGREYEFRYLVNGTDWHNDWNADRYAPNPFGADNSIVSI
jgi:1,4-alpha-glucan branching enzyme